MRLTLPTPAVCQWRTAAAVRSSVLYQFRHRSPAISSVCPCRQQPSVPFQAPPPQYAQQQVATALPPSSWEDLGLTLLAGAIILCILAIVVRKVLQLTGSWDSSDLAGLDVFESFD